MGNKGSKNKTEAVSPPPQPAPQPPPPKEEDSESEPVYVGKYDYQTKAEGDLSFKKGELLCIIDSTEDPDWWLARLKEGGEEGYVPSNHVVKQGSLETEE